MATKVIIPATLGESKPRAPPLEGLPDADGLGEVLVEEDGPEDPVDEDPGEVEEPVSLPVALALKASNDLSAVGFTAKTIPALQCCPW